MAKELRLGVVGLGIGKANGSAVARNPRGRVVAICDIIETKMIDYAKELPQPVKRYTDYRKMCQDKEVDAIFVGTPNQLHVPVAIEAVKNDKHILCTKPLADAVKPAEKLVKMAESAGVVNMMSLSTRSSPEVLHLGALARKGYFGDLYYGRARSVRRSGIPDWNLGFVQKGGGAFRDMGVHVLDATWWLLGQPQPVAVTGVSGAKFGPRGRGYWDFRVPAKSFSRKFAADDFAGGFIRFDGGLGLQVESFWASHQPNDFNLELFGTEAGARLSPLTLYRTQEGAPADITPTIPRKRDCEWDAIAAHFIACCLDGIPCEAPLRHGLLVQQMMEGVLLSAKTGKEVRVA